MTRHSLRHNDLVHSVLMSERASRSMLDLAVLLFVSFVSMQYPQTELFPLSRARTRAFTVHIGRHEKPGRPDGWKRTCITNQER